MGQKLTSHIHDVVAAVPLKLSAAAAAITGGGVVLDSPSRAPLLSEMVIGHIAGHAVTLPILATLVGMGVGLLALLKFAWGVLAKIGGAAAKVRRRDRGA